MIIAQSKRSGSAEPSRQCRSPLYLLILIVTLFCVPGSCLAGLHTYPHKQLVTERPEIENTALPQSSSTGNETQRSSIAIRNNARKLLSGAQSDRFHPGEPWLDADGHLIQAHGGGVLYHGGRYYWFGEDKGGPTYERESQAYHPPRVDVIGVSCYSSTDLLHWKNEGLALRGGAHPDLDKGNVVERPKVLHHSESGTFVMWMHVDTEDYEWARVGVAVSSAVAGPYQFLRSWRPHNQQARDMTVFQDAGDAYIAYSSEENSVMHIARLTNNFTAIDRRYRRILVGDKREAPAIFKFENYFMMLTSGCTGWAPNRPALFYTKEIMGDWKLLGNPFYGGSELERAYSFYSQPTAVIKVEHLHGRYIVMMDQWDTHDLGASRYAWLPMWVDRLSGEELLKGQQLWAQDWMEKRNDVNWNGYWFTVQPAAVHAVVPWHSSWSLQVLDEPLDAAVSRKHLIELRTYPERADETFDMVQDALYGHRAKTV